MVSAGPERVEWRFEGDVRDEVESRRRAELRDRLNAAYDRKAEFRAVKVACDHCGRRVGVIGYLGGEIDQVVLIDIRFALFLEHPDAAKWAWLVTEQVGVPRADRDPNPYQRPGFVVSSADGELAGRYTLACWSIRPNTDHPVRPVTVKQNIVLRAYSAAVDAKRRKITIGELRTDILAGTTKGRARRTGA